MALRDRQFRMLGPVLPVHRHRHPPVHGRRAVLRPLRFRQRRSHGRLHGAFLAPAIPRQPGLAAREQADRQTAQGLLISQSMFIAGSLLLAVGPMLGLAPLTILIVATRCGVRRTATVRVLDGADVVRSASADGSKGSLPTPVCGRRRGHRHGHRAVRLQRRARDRRIRGLGRRAGRRADRVP